MSALESKVDDLYKLPLSEFTGGRNALAKTLSGADAKRVKALQKPTVVPWSINQLYWHARPVYDRLMKSGAALRHEQIAALKGRGGDVRRATEAQREAVAEAVREATTLAAAHGSHPAPDQLARMLEALSLAPTPPEAPGRLAELIQPSGFEALAGITPVGVPSETLSGNATPSRPVRASHLTVVPPSPAKGPTDEKARREALKRTRDEEQRRAKEAAAARKEAESQLKAATRAFEAAQAAEARAQREVDEANDRLERARSELTRTRRELKSAEQEVARLPK